MIARLVSELGPWSWWILGIILLCAEILVPGVFLVWIGIAAVITGLLSLMFWADAWWVWQLQLLVFAALSVVAVLVGRKWLLKSGDRSDEPMLNQRTQSLIGRTADLIEPIVNNRGRAKIDDTVWIVQGPNLPLGTKVRITSVSGRDLIVEAA